jgi:TPR repeat protein
MKAFLALLLVCLMTDAARAQYVAGMMRPRRNAGATAATPTSQELAGSQSNSTANLAAQMQTYQKSFVPADPWRIMNDATNYARGADWLQFEGQVVRVTSDGGLMVKGWFGQPLGYLLAEQAGLPNMLFIVSNYPRHVGVGQLFSRNDHLVALKAGAKDTLPNLDYGKVYVPQLTDDQKTQLAKAKSKADARVLAFQQDLADKGDAYGQYKMGLRYAHGDGVDKDLPKARDLLAKAADQGNRDAADELAKLPAN